MRKLINLTLLFVALFCCSKAFAVGHVQSNKGFRTSAGALTIAFSSNVVSGNLLVVGCGQFNASATAWTGVPTDSQGNTYKAIGHTHIASTHVYAFYALAGSSAANTVTVNMSTSGAFDCAIGEYNGFDVFSSYASASYAAQASISMNQVAAQPGALLVGFGYDQSHASDSWTVTSFTNRQITGNSDVESLVMADRASVSAGNYAPTFATGAVSSNGVGAIVASFNPVGFTPAVSPYVQGAAIAGPVAALAKSYLSNVTSGHKLFALVGAWGNTGNTIPTINTPTDSQGNTWTLLDTSTLTHSSTSASRTSLFWATPGSSGANTVTVTTSNAVNGALIVAEYATVTASGAASTGAAFLSTTVQSGAASATNGDLILSWTFDQSAVATGVLAVSPTTPANLRYDLGSDSVGLALYDVTPTASNNYQASFTTSGDYSVHAGIQSFSTVNSVNAGVPQPIIFIAQ